MLFTYVRSTRLFASPILRDQLLTPLLITILPFINLHPKGRRPRGSDRTMATTSDSDDMPIALGRKATKAASSSNKTDASAAPEPKTGTPKATMAQKTPSASNKGKRKHIAEEEFDENEAPAPASKKVKNSKTRQKTTASIQGQTTTTPAANNVVTKAPTPASKGKTPTAAVRSLTSKSTTPAAKVRSLKSMPATAPNKVITPVAKTTAIPASSVAPNKVTTPAAKTTATPASSVTKAKKTPTAAAKKIHTAEESDNESAFIKAVTGKGGSAAKKAPAPTKKRSKTVIVESSEESASQDSDAGEEYKDEDGKQKMQMVVYKSRTTVRGTARKRKAPSKPPIAKQPIPKSYAECNEADKALIDMRDAGEDWDTITARYGEISGLHTDCKSTLPNRYNRMKTNFVTINDEDAIVLFQAKIEVDKQMADELWERVAEKVEEMGGMPYTVSLRHHGRMSLLTVHSLMLYSAIGNAFALLEILSLSSLDKGNSIPNRQRQRKRTKDRQRLNRSTTMKCSEKKTTTQETRGRGDPKGGSTDT
ncbi:hypothetical protein KVT40_001556 [Elsinoe batatas]|uniref:Myb-like domain-containing protein n=1 Tax=Elsinoe batatas TaxID=2601811 RepID=A0A8K0L6P2_9PEZI|nr:hypothetical protein KVT40_001556 [Elsinoe batatas]